MSEPSSPVVSSADPVRDGMRARLARYLQLGDGKARRLYPTAGEAVKLLACSPVPGAFVVQAVAQGA